MNRLRSCMGLTVIRILRPLRSRADVVTMALVKMDRRIVREVGIAGSIGQMDCRL